MKNIASLRDHAFSLRRALWKSMICFRVVDHDVEQNHKKLLSMVFEFVLFDFLVTIGVAVDKRETSAHEN